MFAAVTTEVIPSPPLNVIVSVARATASVPASPAMFSVVEIETLAAEVMRPFASTENVGICVTPPYVPAETPVEPSVNGMFAFAEPSIETVPLASPETPIVLAVAQVDAVFALPNNDA